MAKLAKEWSVWWSTVAPDFIFLMALPFIVAGAAFFFDRLLHRPKISNKVDSKQR